MSRVDPQKHWERVKAKFLQDPERVRMLEAARAHGILEK